MTVIQGYSDLLLQSLPPGDPNGELVEEIRRAGERSAMRHGILQEQVHFLQKPFSPRALAFKIREVLDSN